MTMLAQMTSQVIKTGATDLVSAKVKHSGAVHIDYILSTFITAAFDQILSRSIILQRKNNIYYSNILLHL